VPNKKNTLFIFNGLWKIVLKSGSNPCGNCQERQSRPSNGQSGVEQIIEFKEN